MFSRLLKHPEQTTDESPSLDEIRKAMGGLLDEKLDPVVETQKDHHRAICGIEDDVEYHKRRLNRIENKIDLVTGDSLGGLPLRLFGALVAVAVGALVSWRLGADDWKVFWWGLAWGLLAFAVIQEIQLQIAVRIKRRDETTDTEEQEEEDIHNTQSTHDS